MYKTCLFPFSMKYLFIILLSAAGFCEAHAQEQTAKLLQETARTLVQKGDYDNAAVILERAKQQEPDNIEILRDLCFANYLKRDFAKAMEVGKELVAKPNADAQSFQVLGMVYKAIASYNDCGKLYRAALHKFPNSGVVYNEYAELFALQNELEEAIVQWEKGIELDPGYSSNYYNAAMYYARKKNWIRVALYGELFLNLESYSTRTEEIKKIFFDTYTNLLSPSAAQRLLDAKTTSSFEKQILEILVKLDTENKQPDGIDKLISIRTRLVLEWFQGKQKDYPFRLFDHQQYLLNQGLFEAYHYWLFSGSLGEETVKAWQKNHPKETDGYKAFQQSRVFKIPVGEYYFMK